MSRRWLAVSMVAVLLGCGDDALPDISGEWNIREAFADSVHSVSCESNGVMSITQSAAVAPGETAPGPSFTGTMETNNDCQGLDGPFTYFGDGTITVGTLSANGRSVSFDAGVNDAECQYEANLDREGAAATDLEGILHCTLVQAQITFTFVGTWSAANWRSEYCEERRTDPGCGIP